VDVKVRLNLEYIGGGGAKAVKVSENV